jgi:hypothetical protein
MSTIDNTARHSHLLFSIVVCDIEQFLGQNALEFGRKDSLVFKNVHHRRDDIFGVASVRVID